MKQDYLLGLVCCLASSLFVPVVSRAAVNTVTVSGERILLNGHETKLIGLRCSNALISDKTTSALIDSLDLYRSYGLNAVSVFVMGSRFGDVKGYLSDGTLNPVYRDRLQRILRATADRNMITIVGCLYWGTSKAKDGLSAWTQESANRAVANTARWLGENGFNHVILDPDNEGMAGREMKWKIEPMIQAAKDVNPALLVANNTKQKPQSEDLNMHFGEKEPGKPWLNSESNPEKVPLSAYWSAFSRQRHDADPTFLNYSRIGRYTAEMKADQLTMTRELLEKHSGMLLAGTWLQCAPAEGVGGPFTQPGGRSELGSSADLDAAWNSDVDRLHTDAGILWWLEFVKANYGPR